MRQLELSLLPPKVRVRSFLVTFDALGFWLVAGRWECGWNRSFGWTWGPGPVGWEAFGA